MGNIEVVFKVGETESAEDTIKKESRNLKTIEKARPKKGQILDVRFIKQIGQTFEDDKMIGLATEYVIDNPVLKEDLSSEQKRAIIQHVIDNLQLLEVTNEAKESGLAIHDGDTIFKDAIFFTKDLNEAGLLDFKSAEDLQKLFKENSESLSAEEMVFCHGDCHGDNIFLQSKPDGKTQEFLLDFEGLRISNKYHDWCEILNKSAFLKHIASTQPEIYNKIQKNIENMWLDPSVQFDDEDIVNHLTGGDSKKRINFSLTKIYDMLSRMITDKDSASTLQQERVKLYGDLIKKEIIKIKSIKN